MSKNSKKSEILNWRVNNPNGTKSECAKELKISGSTVAKWWDLLDTEACPDKLEPCVECEGAAEVVEEPANEETVKEEEKECECVCCSTNAETKTTDQKENGCNCCCEAPDMNKFYKYATYILTIFCVLLFIGCIQGTRKNQEPVIPETKTLSIVADENNKLDYTGNYKWYLDDSGFVYELVDDKVSIIGQTLASLEVAQEDYDGYIEAIKEQFELIPLENLDGYNIVTGDGLNVVVYDADKQIAYEIYLATNDEEVVNEIISSLNIVETTPETSETVEIPEAE